VIHGVEYGIGYAGGVGVIHPMATDLG